MRAVRVGAAAGGGRSRAAAAPRARTSRGALGPAGGRRPWGRHGLFLISLVGLCLLVASPVSEAQPELEQFRFAPPRLCDRDTFRWGFSHRGLPGGLAAVRAADREALQA